MIKKSRTKKNKNNTTKTKNLWNLLSNDQQEVVKGGGFDKWAPPGGGWPK